MAVGFYGKLPSHGDFLQRGVSDAFVNRWDAWLQDGLACSRRDLGDTWADVFLTSPVWRFVLGSGVVGASAWAGIVLPSVDRVGRYFPLTIVASLPAEALPFEVAVAGNGWFDWVESVARRVLAEEFLDLKQLASEFTESERLLGPARFGQSQALLGKSLGDGTQTWQYAFGADEDTGRFFARFAQSLVDSAREPLALWWSRGSQLLSPTVLMTRGLPPANEFRNLLAGSAATSKAMADTIVRSAPFIAPRSADCRFHSVAMSDIGHWRDENQDAYVECVEAGLWVVADGMGGHAGGAIASQLVVSQLQTADGSAEPCPDATAQFVRASLLASNARLRRRAHEEPGFDAGSTVAVLCLGEEVGVVLWVGDSRVYRLRDGVLSLLTRDHSVAEEQGPNAAEDEQHMLTRAIGSADTLLIDEARLEVRPHDRFLVCSDGLYGGLSDAELATGMGAADLAVAVTQLVALSLTHGGQDNVTAILVAHRANVALQESS